MKTLKQATLAILAGACFSMLSATPPHAAIRAAESSTSTHDIHISGELQKRIDLSYAYLLGKWQTIPRNEGWGADQYARWIDAVALLDDYEGKRSPELDRVLNDFLALQKADGSILMNKRTPQEWWGEARAIVCLMQVYEVRHDARVLQAAQRLADFIIGNAPVETAMNTKIHGQYHSSIQGIVSLYRVTGERKYLDFVERVTSIIDPEVAPPGTQKLAHRPITSLVKGYSAHQHHVHSYLEIMQGIVDLYSATGDPKYLEMAKHVWDESEQQTMWVSGGMPEVFGEYFEHNDETCAVAGWILLSLKLFEQTGDARYMNVVETALLNHLSFDQSVQGGFYADRSICLRERVTPDNRGEVADACCSMHGARAVYEALKFIYTADPRGIDVNLFVPSTATLALGGKDRVRLSMQTDYPSSGQLRLAVDPGTVGSKFEIRVRIPAWLASSLTLRVNGQAVAYSKRNGYAVVSRSWRPGDSVEVGYPFSLAIVKAHDNGFDAPRVTALGAHPGSYPEAALQYGPLVLMLDRGRNPGLKGSKFALAVFRRKDGSLFLPPVKGSDVFSGPFQIRALHFDAAVAPAGPRRENPTALRWQKAEVVPMSEMASRAVTDDDPYKVRNLVVILPEKMLRQLPLQQGVGGL